MYVRGLFLSIVLSIILCGNILLAEIPQCINYQGYLVDAEGKPVSDGVYNINFCIYGSEGGTDLLWSSGAQAIQVTDGIFTLYAWLKCTFSGRSLCW